MKRVFLGLIIVFGIMLTSCETTGNKELDPSCETGYLIIDDECVLEENQDSEEINQVLSDALSVAAAAETFCLSELCSIGEELTFYHLEEYLDELDEDYYMLDLYQDGDKLRNIAVLNDAGDFEIYLYAREAGDYEWVNMEPSFFDEAERLSKVEESNGTTLSSGNSIFVTTQKDGVIADALALNQAAQYYCLDNTCSLPLSLTYDDLAPYVDGINQEDYLFDSNPDLIIGYFNTAGDVVITLLAKEDTEYSWITADPTAFSSSELRRDNVVKLGGQVYTDFNFITDWTHLLEADNVPYLVYYYSETCSYCTQIKNIMIYYSEISMIPLYAIDAQSVQGENPFPQGEVGTRTPTLFYVQDGEVVEVVEGVKNVLNLLTEMQSLMASE